MIYKYKYKENTEAGCGVIEGDEGVTTNYHTNTVHFIIIRI